MSVKIIGKGLQVVAHSDATGTEYYIRFTAEIHQTILFFKLRPKTVFMWQDRTGYDICENFYTLFCKRYHDRGDAVKQARIINANQTPYDLRRYGTAHTVLVNRDFGGVIEEPEC